MRYRFIADVSWILASVIFFSANCYNGYKYVNEENRLCGVVTKVEIRTHNSKGKIYYDRYFLMNFDSIGKKSINVDEKTFAKYKEGNKVCFIFSNSELDKPYSTFHDCQFIIGFILAFISVVVLIIYLFDNF